MDSSKYPPEVIKNIAEYNDAGMVCFLNTDTLEVESVMGEGYSAYGDNDYKSYYQEVYDKVEGWENSIRIDPPESWQSFGIMEDFIENCIPDGDEMRGRLRDAISKGKPFRNFKLTIDGSRHRQSWFNYKQSRLEQLVSEQLSLS